MSRWIWPCLTAALILLQHGANSRNPARLKDAPAIRETSSIHEPQLYDYALHYWGLVPAYSRYVEAHRDDPAIYTPEAAARILAEHGATLRMESQNALRVGERMVKVMKYPVFLVQDSIRQVSHADVMAFLWVLGLILLAFALHRSAPFPLGIVLPVILSSSGFLAKDIYYRQLTQSVSAIACVYAMVLLCPLVFGQRRTAGGWVLRSVLLAAVMVLLINIRSAPFALYAGIAAVIVLSPRGKLAACRETEVLPIACGRRGRRPSHFLKRLECSTREGRRPRRPIASFNRPLSKRLVLLACIACSHLALSKAFDVWWEGRYREAVAVVRDLGGRPFTGHRAAYHDIYHGLWIGLADFDRTYGYRWSDNQPESYGLSVLRAQGVDVDAGTDGAGTFGVFVPGYEATLRARLLDNIRADPAWYVRILTQRLHRIVWENEPPRIDFLVGAVVIPGGAWLSLAVLVAVLGLRLWHYGRLFLLALPTLAIPLVFTTYGGQQVEFIGHLVLAAIGVTLLARLCARPFRQPAQAMPDPARRADGEVVVLAILLALFAGCLLTIRPNESVIAAAMDAKQARDARHAAWLEQHPIARGLRLALPLDGTIENLVPDAPLRMATGAAFAPGRNGEGLQGGPGMQLTAEEFTIQTAATWAVWARLDPQAPTGSVMRLLDANGCHIGLESDRLEVSVLGSPWQWQSCSVARPVPGQWFHVAASWDGGAADGRLTLYLDGEPVRSRACTGRVMFPHHPLVIGTAHDGTRAFTGTLDEVCVFDRALQPQEVAALAWLGLDPLRTLPGERVTASRVHAAREAWRAAQDPPAQRAAVAVPATPAAARYRGLDLGIPFDRGLELLPAGRHAVSITGAPQPAPGLFGQAGQFSGRDALAISGVPIQPEGTWAAWVRLADDYDRRQTMRLLDANGTGIQIEGQQLTGFLYENSGTRYAGGVVQTGAWFHVALTWGRDAAGKGAMRLYRNGEQQGVSDYGGQPAFPERTLVVGAGWDFTRGFQGALDDVCVFQRCLSNADVLELMERGLSD